MVGCTHSAATMGAMASLDTWVQHEHARLGRAHMWSLGRDYVCCVFQPEFDLDMCVR